MNAKLFMLIILMIVGIKAAEAQPFEKVRLSKVRFKGNDFKSETDYEYDDRLRIKKIIFKQDGKQHYVVDNFVFNEHGLLASYITTYNLKISPQKTVIYYDENKQLKRLETVNTKKSDKSDTIEIFNFSRNSNFLTVKSASRTTVYQFNEISNITRVEFSTNGADPFLFDRYDHSPNPLTLTGGYIDKNPLSRNNHAWEQLGGDRYKASRKITYEKILVHKFTPGGAKIPTLYQNGLPLQIVTSWYDPDAKRMLITETIDYTYLKPAS